MRRLLDFVIAIVTGRSGIADTPDEKLSDKGKELKEAIKTIEKKG